MNQPPVARHSDVETPPDSTLESRATPPLFVTVEDHCNGFKRLLVETRAGETKEIILHAPSRKVTRSKLNLAVPPDGFPWHVISLCLDPHLVETMGEKWLDQLVPDSAALVEVTAFCLTFGSATQKKIEALALANLTRLANSAPSSASAPPAGPVRNSTPGAGPSSGSALDSPSSKS